MDSSHLPGPLQTTMVAESGGNICAPFFSGNNIQGPVTVNMNVCAQKCLSPVEGVPTSSTPQDGPTHSVPTIRPESMEIYKQELIKKYKKINEGHSKQGRSALLNEIYTNLYITEGGSGEVNKEHEVRQIETVSRRPAAQEKPIKCSQLFKDKAIRTVLTKGVAGIGKTVSVQKFILDWAEGKENQDVLFIFPLPFRELNLTKKIFTLLELLHKFFPKIKELKPIDCDSSKVLFIFDGLDECRPPLDFQKNEGLWDVTESASVDVLLTNLIKGNLLPSALLWITSRPAAANQIPPECVDQLTEVRGFSDHQKEQYFRKRISDQSLANQIISHIKSSRSLYIMCHIPVFCWISATVLERVLCGAEGGETLTLTPKTLTQMFTHFMIFQIKHKEQKYQGKQEVDLQKTRESVLALGKLAFQQLEKGNLIFYEDELRECGIDVREVSVYSGVCTQIFRQEFELHLGKVFSFVHLSVQEFLAALYAFLSFLSKDEPEQSSTDLSGLFRASTMSEFLKCAVDKALQSENGHLDLFLRFLLGLSLESNQTLFQGILTQTGIRSHSTEETVQYIKEKIRENPSPETSINLFHCLNELGDCSLEQEVQEYLNRGDYPFLSGLSLSPAQWSAVVFVLLNSEDVLEDFGLHKYDSSEECFLKLLPVVNASRKAVIWECYLTEKSCAALASALSSNSSNLRELNLSYNQQLHDSGVNLLFAGMESPHCKLEKLGLYSCELSEKICPALASALSSKFTKLKELDLSLNNLQDTGVQLLCGGLENPHCKLKKLRLYGCNVTEKGCAALASALSSTSSSLRVLDLGENKQLLHSGVELLCAGLENPHCKLETLGLWRCNLTEKSCAALASSLSSNSSSLRELDLHENEELQDSGVEKLCAALENPLCKLETLRLQECNLSKKSCAALATALSSNSSCLRELNLGCNPKLQDSGVKLLCAGLKSPHCKLETLGLYECNLTEKSCAALGSALSSNSSSLRELDLSGNKKLKDSGVKLLCVGLENSLFKLETLELYNCNLTEKSCAALGSALSSNSSSLRKLEVSCNKLKDSGVKLLCAGLKNPHCKLEKLDLSNCKIRAEGCAALASALKSNPAHLRELILMDSDPGELGNKLLSDLLDDPLCKLQNLEF